MPSELQDTQARQTAVDPECSFIVQAPAGSGKTSLLIQRYLQLLTKVDKPEEVLAITFTRKAAEEMRDRVIGELQKAQRKQPVENEYERQTRELADAVLKLDEQRETKRRWDLLLAKERLRIKTIDSFCLYLANRLPVGSHFGAPLAPSEDSGPLYRSAVLKALSEIDSVAPDHQARRAYESMLRFCNNDKSALIDNLCTSLQNRSLWQKASRTYLLDLCSSDKKTAERAKDYLNRQLTLAIRQTVTPQLQDLDRFFRSKQLTDQVFRLMHHSLKNLISKESTLALRSSLEKGLEKLNGWPEKPTTAYFTFYQAVRALFLSGNSVRNTTSLSICATQGFPKSPPQENTAQRDLFVEIIEEHRQELQKRFDNTTVLTMNLDNDDGSGTAYSYSTDQLAHLGSTAYLLEICYNYLRDEFRRQGVCDYTEISGNAVEALGSDSAPSELALQLDSEIKHILVDEYQDTSQAQLELLERLTANWHRVSEAESDKNRELEKRTIFMVGDPMQSIYRFRQADVGIYLRTCEYGLTNITPSDKKLETNFRSDDTLIRWFNDSFSKIFPDQNDRNTSAITYSTAASPLPEKDMTAAPFSDNEFPNSTPRVFYHVYKADSKENKNQDEAQFVLALVRQERERIRQERECRLSAGVSEKPQKLAVLFQKRDQAKEVIKLLRQQQIPFIATDIEMLSDADPIQDLIVLTKAMLHLNDSISWLALLRSRLVGLNDSEITRLAESDKSGSLWEIISNPDSFSPALWPNVRESKREEAEARCRHLHKVISQALEVRGEQPLSRWVKGTWIALGGPRSLDQEQDGDLVSEYFSCLDEIGSQNMPDAAELDRLLEKRYAVPNACAYEEIPVLLMTMHAAKGLEFDTVILPFLEGTTDSREYGLLRNAAVYPDNTKDGLTVFSVQVDNNTKLIDTNADSSEDDKSDNEENDEAKNAADSSPNAVLYDYLKRCCDLNEKKRLLYVAATRAKKYLYLVAFASPNKDKKLSLSDNSMAGILTALDEVRDMKENPRCAPSAAARISSDQPVTLSDELPAAVSDKPIPTAAAEESETGTAGASTADSAEELPVRLTRQAWELEPLEAGKDYLTTPDVHDKVITKDTAYGNTFHTLMELIGQYGLMLPELTEKSEAQEFLINRLIEEALCANKDALAGINTPIPRPIRLFSKEYDALSEDLRGDLQAMLDSPLGRWAMEPHEQSSYEQTVCYSSDLAPELEEEPAVPEKETYTKLNRLDRVFFDHGKFWIIDYKTGSEHPEKYHKIMNRYARLMELSQGHEKICLALVYVSREREQGEKVYSDCGLYENGETKWGLKWEDLMNEKDNAHV